MPELPLSLFLRARSLGCVFPSEILHKISQHLSADDLIRLYLACSKEHFAFKLGDLAVVRRVTLDGPSCVEEVMSFIKTISAFSLKSSVAEEFIRDWMLIDKERFNSNNNLFMYDQIFPPPYLLENSYCPMMNACRFFSCIGAATHLITLKECASRSDKIKDHRSILVDNEAFIMAAKGGYVDVLKLLWSFADGYNRLKIGLLKHHDCEAFLFAIKGGHINIVKLLWGFAGDHEGLRESLLRCGNCSAFARLSETENVEMLLLLLKFSEGYPGLMKDLLRHRICECLCSVSKVSDALWAAINDRDDLKREALRIRYEKIDEESIRILSEQKMVNSLGLLWNLTYGDEREKLELSKDNYCNAFRRAARCYNISELELLWKVAGVHKGLRELFLTANNYDAFLCAAGKSKDFFLNVYDGDILKLLWEFACDCEELRKTLLQADDFRAFITSAAACDTETLKLFWDFAGSDVDLRCQLLMANDCKAFINAALNGYIDGLKLLWSFDKSNVDLKRKLFTANDCWAFVSAAKNGHINVLELLWDFAASPIDLRCQLLMAADCAAFVLAAREQKGDVLKLLWKFAGSYIGLRRRLLMALECSAFTWVAKKGNISLLELLWDFAGKDRFSYLNLFTSQDGGYLYSAFSELLWKVTGTYVSLRKQLLTQRNYHTFRESYLNGRIESLKLLLKFAESYIGLRGQLLTSDNCGAFRWAWEKDHVEMLKFLCDFVNGDETLLKSVVTHKAFKEMPVGLRWHISKHKATKNKNVFMHIRFFKSSKEENNETMAYVESVPKRQRIAP